MTDIVIIGGGIAGLSAAAHLSRFASVTVLERESQTGYHTSGRSAAVFIADYGNATVRALNRASLPDLSAMGALSPRDLLLVAAKSQADAFDDEVAQFQALRLSPAEALAMFPILNTDAMPLAARYDQARDLDTDLMLQHATRTARSNGAVLHTHAEVTGLRHHHNRWHITTAQARFSADLVVNAAGAWADPVAALAGLPPLGIQPYRRSIAQIPAPAGLDVTHWPLVDAVGESWYMKPQSGALLVSPADEDPMPPCDAYSDDLVLAEGLDRYGQSVTTPITRVQSSWAGLRSFAPDRSLVIGPDPRVPGFCWCAGQGGYGFQTAPAAAMLLASLLNGHNSDLPPEIVKTLLPDRLLT